MRNILIKSLVVLLSVVVFTTMAANVRAGLLNPPGPVIQDEGETPEAPEATEPPSEPPTEEPSQPEATAPPSQPGAPSAGGTGIVTLIILGGLGLLVLIIVLFIVMRPRSPAPSTQPPQPAPQEPAAVTIQSYLQSASPQARSLYNRFADLVESFGPVSIVPTQTRIDFQGRIIFASAQLYPDSLLVSMLLPRRIDRPRVTRVDALGDEKYLHYLSIRSLDDFDAEFTAWLQEAYKLGMA